LSPELIRKLDSYVDRLKSTAPPATAARGGQSPVQTVQPQTVKRAAGAPVRPAAIGDEAELLRRLCWLLCRGSLAERTLEGVVGVPQGSPEALRFEMFARLQGALGLERPPLFLGPDDAADVRHRLDTIERLTRSAAR